MYCCTLTEEGGPPGSGQASSVSQTGRPNSACIWRTYACSQSGLQASVGWAEERSVASTQQRAVFPQCGRREGGGCPRSGLTVVRGDKVDPAPAAQLEELRQPGKGVWRPEAVGAAGRGRGRTQAQAPRPACGGLQQRPERRGVAGRQRRLLRVVGLIEAQKGGGAARQRVVQSLNAPAAPLRGEGRGAGRPGAGTSQRSGTGGWRPQPAPSCLHWLK